MTLTDEQITRFATPVHEAGHAVVGVIHGAEVIRAEVIRGGHRTYPRGIAGYCMHEDFGIEASASHRAITAAGTVAEAVLRYGPNPTARQIDALLTTNHQDRASIRRMCFAVGEPVTVPTEVLPLVTRCWESIAHLAGRLAHYGEVRHTDGPAALGIPSGSSPEVVAHCASLIRSGDVPKPLTPAAV